MIGEFGALSLISALVVALFMAVMLPIALYYDKRRLINAVKPLTLLLFILVCCSFASLIYLYVISDFSVINVVENSHSEKPLLYKITGVWGNHEGSMLLWGLILCFYSTLIALFTPKLTPRFKALVIAVQSWLCVAFFLFILLTSNPFLRQNPPALQGKDLNPILQDIGLAIHPPLLYLGYVGFSVCFSFAIAALINGRVDTMFARFIRPWTLLSWIFLTGGIMLGSYWAYYELGWGGYWFWDPVENASLMPWLVGTALLHSAIVLEKRGALKIWTIFLSILTFSLSLIGTFLVRSGVLTSVHSFAVDPLRGNAILLILFIFIGLALLLFAIRASSLKKGGLFQPISREGLLVINNLFLTTITATVFIGTLYPLLLEIVTGQKISVGAPFFNMTFAPLMVPLLLLIPFGPIMAWKRGDFLAVAERLFFALALAVLAIFLLFFIYNQKAIIALAGIGLAIFVIVGSLTDLWVKTGKKKTDLSTRFKRFLGLKRSIYGTALAHIGVGVSLFGIIAVATFSQERILTMNIGDTTTLAGKTIQLLDLENGFGSNYSTTKFRFHLSETKHNAMLIAEKRFYSAVQMPTTEAAIKTQGLSQIYIAPGEVGEQGLVLHIWWKAQVIAIWLGAILMMLGGIISLTDRNMRIGAPKNAKNRNIMPTLPNEG